MREKALQLGFATVLALLMPASAVCSSHTTKAAARPAHPVSPAARPSLHTHETGSRAAHAEPRAGTHAISVKAAAKMPPHSSAKAAAAQPRNARETASARKPGRPLTKAELRAQAAEDAREAKLEARLEASSRHGGKAVLATNRHPLRDEPEIRPAASRGRMLAPAQPAPQRVASLSAERPLPEPDERPAAPLTPVNVHHNRKQHFTAAADSADDAPLAGVPGGAPSVLAAPPQTASPRPPAASAPRTAAPANPMSGVSHPDEMDEQAPLTPAAHPIAVPMAQTRIQPVPGIGRSAPQAQRAAIGAPLVMTVAAAVPTSSIMTSAQPMPPPAMIPQVQPSAAVRARLPSIEAEVVETQLVPSLLYNHGQLVVPPALKGSHEILVHQNTEADREGLTRVRDDEDLNRMRTQKLLVALPDETGLVIDERLPANRRYARPWTAKFLADLARAHYAHFHTELIVTSAVRTVEVQQRLIRTNGNAAPAEGETASPHLTGQAVDLGKKGLSMTEIAWMRGYLLPLVQQGKVDVEEEFQQACFHISVYHRYMPSAPGAAPTIITRRSPAGSLATALPLK